jgi:hypothetical protein
MDKPRRDIVEAALIGVDMYGLHQLVNKQRILWNTTRFVRSHVGTLNEVDLVGWAVIAMHT